MTNARTTASRTFGFSLLLAVFLAFTVTPAQAQTDISPGVRAGVDFMTLEGDDVDGDNFDRRTGFMVGGFALIDFEGPFALQPELAYVQKGSTSEITTGGTTFNAINKLDYIEIPVLAKFQIPVEGSFSPNIFAGPALGFNVNAEREVEGGGQSSGQDVSDEISGTEFSLAFGAGADIGLGAGTLSFDFRYGLGLTSIADTDADQFVRNQGFMITAGYAF